MAVSVCGWNERWMGGWEDGRWGSVLGGGEARLGVSEWCLVEVVRPSHGVVTLHI